MEQVQTCHGEASNAIIWISRESFRHEVAEMLVFSRRIGTQDSQPQQSERETGERRGVAGIEAQRLFAGFIDFRMVHGVLGVNVIVKYAITASQRQVLGVRITRAPPARFGRFDVSHLQLQSAGEPRDDVVLHLQKVAAVFIETLRPEMRAGFRVDELGVDPDAARRRLHRAFQHIFHAEILADRLHVGRLALEGEGRVARDDELSPA